MKEYQITIDTTRETRNPVVHVNTNDLQTVKFIINVLNQGKFVDLTGSTVRIAIKKPDNKTVFQDCKITDAAKGKCEVVLNTQAYIVAGPHYAEVMIYYTTDKVSVSGRFIYGANKGILDDKTIKSTNEWQSITQAIADAEGVLEDLRKNGTGVDAQARTDIQSITTELASKASQDVVRLKSVKLELEDLSESTLGAMSGNATFNLLSIPQDGSTTYDKLGQDLKRAINGNVINLYNPSLAVDGKLNSYANGTYSDFATGAVSGKIPVQPGKSYTISLPSTESGFDAAFRCFDINKVFIGNSRTVSTNPVAAGASSGTQFTANGRKQVTITLASDSLVRFIETSIIFPYVAHTTADFDRIRNSIQFEEGFAFSKFETYGTAIPKVLDAAMPNSYSLLTNDVNTMKQILNGDTKLIKIGNLLYIRTAWNDTSDLLQKMQFVTNGGFTSNNIFQFIGYGLIPKDTLDSDVQTASYTEIKVATDDTTPFQYNGTYIGASHGAYKAVNLLASAHGKTVRDIGSEWTDSSGRKFYIIRIVDANNLWVLSENIAANGTWDFKTVLDGTTLTHSLNATNTATITFSTQTVTQIIQAEKNVSRKILLNNKVEVLNDGTYTGESIQIVETYDISSPLSLLEFIKSRVGSSVEPSFTDPSINADVRNIITYSFYNNGSCTIYNSAEFINQVKIDYFGMVQSNALPLPSGGKIYEYIPKTLPTLAGGVTYDPKNKANITNLSASLDLPKTSWEQADNPPDRFIQFTENSSGGKHHGITVGYCPTIGLGKKEIRKSLINSAFFISAAKKQYPKAVSKGNTTHTGDLIPSSSFYEGVAFRCPINYSLYSDATNVSWYVVNGVIYLMIDYHSNVDKKLRLPDSFLNKQIEVIEKTDSFSLLSSFVNPDGVRFKVAGGYGYAVLKLS